MLLCPLAGQTIITYPNFSNTSGLQMNDAVVQNDTVLLASSQSDRRGSLFTTQQYNVAEFSAVFEFMITSPGGLSDGIAAGADGLTFALQRNSPGELGNLGFGLGYGGISSSLAVEFDTFRNNNLSDPSSNHIGINSNGSMTSVSTVDIASPFDNGTKWTVWVDYNGTTLEVRASNNDQGRPLTATLSYTIDLPGTIGGSAAYIGFTAATGQAFGNHEILGFAFSETYQTNGLAAVPEPSTYALLGLGLTTVLFWSWRRRAAAKPRR